MAPCVQLSLKKERDRERERECVRKCGRMLMFGVIWVKDI